MTFGHMTERNNKGLAYSAEDIRFTTRENFLYAIALDWPENGAITVKSMDDEMQVSTKGIKAVSLVGSDAELDWTRDGEGLHVTLPEARPCDNAYCLKIELKGGWNR